MMEERNVSNGGKNMDMLVKSAHVKKVSTDGTGIEVNVPGQTNNIALVKMPQAEPSLLGSAFSSTTEAVRLRPMILHT